MRVKTLLYIIRALTCLVVLPACDEEEAKDRVETVTMFVSEQTGTYRPWDAPEPLECMLVKVPKVRHFPIRIDWSFPIIK